MRIIRILPPEVVILHTIKKAQYLEGYKLQLSFDDKSVKIVDLGRVLKNAKNMLLPLRNAEYFKQFKCDGITLIWPNGVDFCPDVLYRMGRNAKHPTRKSKPVASRRKKKSKTKA